MPCLLLTSLLFASYSVFSSLSQSCGNEHIKAIWSHSSWTPMSFLASLFPETLILIACFFALAFFSNLKGPEPFLGLRVRQSTCLKAAEVCWAGDVSGVIPAVQCNLGMPLCCQLSWTNILCNMHYVRGGKMMAI